MPNGCPILTVYVFLSVVSVASMVLADARRNAVTAVVSVAALGIVPVKASIVVNLLSRYLYFPSRLSEWITCNSDGTLCYSCFCAEICRNLIGFG